MTTDIMFNRSGFSRAWMRITAIAAIFAMIGLPVSRAALAQDPVSRDIQGASETRALLATAKRISVIAELAAGNDASLSAGEINTTRLHLAQHLAAVGVTEVRPIGSLPFVALEVTQPQLEALLASGLIKGVSENARVTTNLFDSVPLIGGPEAWSLGARGAGQSVVIVDSGVESSHPFFNGRVVRGVCSATDCGSGVIDQPGAGEPNAGCYHGTHVAGIAAGRGDTFSGVAPDASIISVRVFQCNSTPWENVIRGLDYIYTTLRLEHKIAAVNMSLGDSSQYASACDNFNTAYQAMAAAINNLRNAGIATAVASGNNSYNSGISAPACIDNAIAAGSVTKQDAVSYFSNSGPNLDVLAPGSSIYSSVLNGSFDYLSGTSMATPHVAGAIAALRSRLPNATIAQIEQALETTGVWVTDADSSITRRRIDVADALGALGVSPGPHWRTWEQFGGSILYSPECLTSSATQTDCWAVLASGSLGWWRYNGTTSPSLVTIAGAVKTAPSCLYAGGKLQCFAVLGSRQLGQSTQTGLAWSAWRALGDNLNGRPSCVSVDGTKITCVATNASKKLRTRSWSGTAWTAWSSLAANVTVAAPPTCYVRAGGIDCMVNDTNNRLQYLRRNSAGKWAAPKNLGGAVTGFTSCIAFSPTTRSCFIQGVDNTLQQIYFGGTSWGSWINLGGAIYSAPSCAVLGKETHCFAAASNGTLQQARKVAGVWKPWANLGGTLALTRPACVTPSSARLDCFAHGLSNSLAHLAYY